jgi:AraC-like DNA-binding protein
MLYISDICIADLAYECGFTSPDYFIRLYKKYYGTTPGAYRKNLRSENEKTVN